MSQDLLICPHCHYENIVLTCGFCLQCGEDVFAAPLSPQLRAEAITPGCSAAGFEDTTLSRLIKQAAAKLKASHTETDRGWRLTIRVGGGRKQTVHVLRGGEDEGLELVAFLSLCGPARPELAMKLLEWNSRLIHCAFAIRLINGERMMVLGANLAIDSLTLPMVTDALSTIAFRGDYVEQRMSAGADRF